MSVYGLTFLHLLEGGTGIFSYNYITENSCVFSIPDFRY
jgi:hypothetical protein